MICVYRLYDTDGGLLWVGTTANFKARLAHHKSTRSWGPDIFSHIIEEFPTAEDAAMREEELIESLAPLFNVRPGGEQMPGPRKRHSVTSSNDQGFSVKLSREMETVVKKLSKEEDRSLRSIIERAIRLYEHSVQR